MVATELAYPDTLVGTDSHTTMVNGLSVLGWGVGGIEAEAAMLGQPYSMLLPEVIGVRLNGKLKEGVTATDLVLTVTQMLRKRGVVGKFVEYFGPGLADLSIADRATLGNMAPEYGATCGFFPIDDDTLRYLRDTGRTAERIALVLAYAKAQGMYHTKTRRTRCSPTCSSSNSPRSSRRLPGRSARRTACRSRRSRAALPSRWTRNSARRPRWTSAFRSRGATYARQRRRGDRGDHVLHQHVEPERDDRGGAARQQGGREGPHGQAVGEDLAGAGLASRRRILREVRIAEVLDALGFNLVGFGCTTCIGNSGPLPEEISEAINKNDLVAAAVLSGNRNFEGRVNADVRANYLASPPLVVAYAIAGSMQIDVAKAPLGTDRKAQGLSARYLAVQPRDRDLIRKNINKQMFTRKYGDVFKGDANWRKISVQGGLTFKWDDRSTYVQNPPYFEGMQKRSQPIEDIVDARILGLFLDSITTDHISPAGSIKEESPAGEYLRDHQVRPKDFNQYGTRRGNHQVMMRGTFANIRIKNQMVPGVEGGYTIHYPSRSA